MKYLYLLFVLSFFTSCKKEPLQYKTHGVLVDINTNEKISNAELKFYETVVNSNVLNPNFIYLGTTTTNSVGEYSFNFERKKADEFKIEVSHPHFYNITEVYSSALLSTAKSIDFSFKLESKSWIKIRLKNTFVLANEHLNFYKHNIKNDCSTCCSSGNVAVPYTNPDTTFICPVVGGLFFKYTYGEVLQNSSTTDSILCVKNDTTELFIQY